VDKPDLDALEDDLKVLLSQMSDSWITQLHEAATLADNDLIADLVKSVPPDNNSLIQSLISLVDNFCYNQIIKSTQQALKK